jgi:hypothetical protein
VHVVTVVEQVKQGEVQARQVAPLSEYPEIHAVQVVDEVEQAEHGEVHEGQVAPLR